MCYSGSSDASIPFDELRSNTHLFHCKCWDAHKQMINSLNALIPNWKGVDELRCPHCGSRELSSIRKVKVTVTSTLPPVFLSKQEILAGPERLALPDKTAASQESEATREREQDPTAPEKLTAPPETTVPVESAAPEQAAAPDESTSVGEPYVKNKICPIVNKT